MHHARRHLTEKHIAGPLLIGKHIATGRSNFGRLFDSIGDRGQAGTTSDVQLECVTPLGLFGVKREIGTLRVLIVSLSWSCFGEIRQIISFYFFPQKRYEWTQGGYKNAGGFVEVLDPLQKDAEFEQQIENL